MIPEVILKDERAYSPKLIRASGKNDTSHGRYWSSVANRSMQWYRKGGMYSIGLEIRDVNKATCQKAKALYHKAKA